MLSHGALPRLALPRRFSFRSAETVVDNDDTALIKIEVVRVLEARNGKRAWDIKITYNGQRIHDEESVELLDRFNSKEYEGCFKFLADGSFKIAEKDRTEQERNDIENAKVVLENYGLDLVEQTRLDSDHEERQHKSIDILIIEDHKTNDDDEKSVHNLVWELLEHPGFWKRRKPERVTVTRTIAPPDCPFQRGNWTRGLLKDGPIRILLIVARDISKTHSSKTKWTYNEKAPPDMVQRSLMQVMQHLEEIGCNRTVQLDILRPATFNELTTYLNPPNGAAEEMNPTNGAAEKFDIIHVDMHGTMKVPVHQGDGCSAEKPHLVFTQAPFSEPYVSATELADTLHDRTKALVVNACNESSLTGELGIQMIRVFLNQYVDCIAATSYRLEVTPAKIYYPTFYMSLLLNGSLNKAAAEGRHALRKNLRRQGDEERDDHYVHWNWSIYPDIQVGEDPAPSFRLLFLMLLECIPRIIAIFCAFISSNRDMWRCTQAERYPMYNVHRNFKKIESHVCSAKQFNVPGITLEALDIEYQLRKDENLSIYLHPPHKNALHGLSSIKNLVRTMVRIWVETNFVAEAVVLSVKEMLKLSESLKERKITRYDAKFRKRSGKPRKDQAEWCWYQADNVQGRKQPEVKSMLVIEDIQSLVEDKSKRQEKVLNRIRQVAGQMEGRFFVITIGGLLENEWRTSLPNSFADGAIGKKWVRPTVMMIPYNNNSELSATFK